MGAEDRIQQMVDKANAQLKAKAEKEQQDITDSRIYWEMVAERDKILKDLNG